jgi:predicted dehydrogenase
VPQPLRVVVIGPGFIARRHLEVLATEPGAELVGVLGRRPGSADEAAARFGGRPYHELERMLDAERPDAAWICLPPDQHGVLELALLERGIHLFVEKPLAADLETPLRIADAIAAAGLVAGVAYHWRAMDTLREVEDVIAGRPVRLLTGHWHDSLPGPAWWRDERRGGGQMVEQATHLVDLSRRLLGEATVVAATADRHDHPDHPGMTVPDVSTALLRYEAGPVGAFTATCVLGGTSAQEVRLFADGLAITIRQQGVLYEDARTKAVTATDGFTGSRLWGVTATRYVPTGNDPFRDEDQAFLDAIRHGDSSRLFSSYADAVRTHRLTCAIRDAAGGFAPSG